MALVQIRTKSRWWIPVAWTLCFLAGCAGDGGWFGWMNPRQHPEPPAPKPSAAASVFSDPHAGQPRPLVDVIRLKFDVVRVDVPVTNEHHALKVWNHVDELRCDAQIAEVLTRNGIRLGVASGDSWPALQTIFTNCAAKVQRGSQLVQTPLPLTVELGRIEDGTSIFSYDRAGRLRGETFEPGTKFVHIDYRLHPQLDGSCDLSLTLEVQPTEARQPANRWDGLLNEPPEIVGHVYRDLAATATLGPQEFLVIGPGERADQAHLLGGQFFTREESAQLYETIICIAPQPYRAAAPGSDEGA
jgi:hypothetical protein